MTEFEARGPEVWQKPIHRATGTTMGFHVLTVSESLADPAAVARVLAVVMSEDYRFNDKD